MRYLFDTHVHVYPFYDLELFFRSAFSNLRGGTPILFLTERFDCHFFRDAAKQGRGHFGSLPFAYDGEHDVLRVQGERELVVVPGRQIVSAEKIEVLALGRDLKLADGVPIRELIQKCVVEGAFVILPWSLGKWSGVRGEVIRALLEESSLDFSLGDPGHRGFSAPLLTQAKRRILCGSDPLPVKGDERRVGSYAMSCEDSSLADPRELLRSGKSERYGARVGLISALMLQLRLRASAKP